MSIEKHLDAVADAGLALGHFSHNHEYLYDFLTTLLAIEEALDAGRILLTISESNTTSRKTLNQKLDELRSNIRNVIDQCDVDEFQVFMAQRAQRLGRQFSGQTKGISS